MYHPAARREEDDLSGGASGLAPLPTHTHTHLHTRVTNHSQGVTLAEHSVSIKQVGRKDKRACFAYNMRVHTEQIPICSLYLVEAKLTECACCFTETLGVAEGMCSCIMLDSEELQSAKGLFKDKDIFISKSPDVHIIATNAAI